MRTFMVENAIKHRCWLSCAGTLLWALGLIIITNLYVEHVIEISQLSLVIISIIIVLHAFIFWWKRWLGFLLHIGPGVFYFCLASFLVNKKFTFAFIVTAIFSYIIIGIFRIRIGKKYRKQQKAWNWTLIAGLIDLALGLYLMYGLSTFGLVLSSGMDTLFTGWALFKLGENARVKTTEK